eukprot:9474966-Pyramimonas_sp.AAC.1
MATGPKAFTRPGAAARGHAAPPRSAAAIAPDRRPPRRAAGEGWERTQTPMIGNVLQLSAMPNDGARCMRTWQCATRSCHLFADRAGAR